jgi:hypothetical protein
MATVNVKVLERAENFGFMTPEEARMAMQIAEGDMSVEFLQFTIDMNSSIIATLCNRTFARQRVRETWRCLGEPCDCTDAAVTRRLFLTHFPVKEEDIESVESPRGYPTNAWELEEDSGVLQIWATAEPIEVTYTGGYELPDEAPPALKYAATILVRQDKASAQAEQMAGVRMIAHKEARIVYHQAGTTQTATAKGGGATPALESVKNLLSHFTRLWI